MDSPQKSNYLEFIGYIILAILFALGVLTSLTQSQIPFALVSGLLTLLAIYQLGICLKNGLRAPNRFEWFKYWMTLRPILFGALMFGAIWLFAVNGRTWLGEERFESDPVMISAAVFAVLMLILTIYFVFRAPYRSESDERYKARIGWKDAD